MLCRDISTNGSSLKAVHVHVNGGIYKRFIKELGKDGRRKHKTAHTFQGLPVGRHKHSMIDIIL